ncbi:MFS general substrate transporter [Aureobasidium pullulans]|uniref:MFS general substrate transporter n=1 Tax=Aureobasidium pullulans TaxID=5580 RepID=A0A4S9Y6U6_AURPU|nr:MFS general substrate transporter [Aureobasidium pullulans]
MGKEVQAMPSSPGSSAKEDIMHIEDKNMTKDEKIAAIDAIAEDPSVTLESFAHLDINKILRKIDMRLVPMLTILYLLSFLDRGNIGNAKIEGLAEDLKLTGAEYNWCLTAFFFTYCAFEVPSNMLLKKLRPSIWLPSIMVAWGIVMTLMGLVKDFHGLLIARIFLGVTEAGLFPGVVFYNTMWYCRYEVQVRQAIFILEGLLTFLVAIVAYFVLVDYPETASFLTVEERAFITYRLKYDGQDANTEHGYRVAQTDRSDKKFLFAAFRDWQIWVNIVVYWGYVCPLYGISLFLPTIIKELGYKTTTAQLLTVPIYVVASAITIAVAYAADRKRLRSPWILVGLCFQAIGFIMCISTSHPGVTYAGIFIAACALYQCQPSNITWLSNNLSGSYKRAVGMGIQISVGNLAGAMASNFYRSTDAPRYILGHGLEIGFICMGIVALLIQVFNYRRINKQREASLTAGEAENFTPEALGDLGDKAVTYRYTL